MELYQPLIHFDWNLLFSALTFLSLFLILKHFFFDKVHKFMMDRQQAVEDQLEAGRQAEAEAARLQAEYDDIIDRAENDGRDIIKQSKKAADERADNIINDAKAKAADIVHTAEKQAEIERERAVHDMKDEIAELAIMAAGQIVKKDLAQNGEHDLIERIIEEAGGDKWQS